MNSYFMSGTSVGRESQNPVLMEKTVDKRQVSVMNAAEQSGDLWELVASQQRGS